MPGSRWDHLFTTTLDNSDPQVATLINNQRRQDAATVNLVASESYCPRSTIEAEASLLVNKNASGYPPRPSCGGSEIIDAVETLATSRARQLFKAEHANIEALSSTIANIAVMRALLDRGDRILVFDQRSGGHMSHGARQHISGQEYTIRSFGVDIASERIDYDAASRAAKEFRPRMIIAGSTSYPYMIDFKELRNIADENGAMLFGDIAHVSGLVAAGIHPNPIPICDVATTSTHKTLCGPRTGGLILCQSKYAKKIDSAVTPGLQAAPGVHIIAARAVLFDLVRRPPFRELMKMVAANARSLADRFCELGVPLYSGGTDTHMVVVDLRGSEWVDADLNAHLFRHGITATTVSLPSRGTNENNIGLRLGSTPMTIRNADKDAFRRFADVLARLLPDSTNGSDDSIARGLIADVAKHHPVPLS